jgi:hypothetical protein
MSKDYDWQEYVEIDEDLIYGFDLEAIKQALNPHPWKDDLKSLMNMLSGSITIPHETSDCNDCRKASTMRLKYLLEERKQHDPRRA